MKATQDSSFRPITLILETQEEVDMVQALLNTGKLTNLLGVMHKHYFKPLELYASTNCDALIRKISESMK